MSSNSHSIPHSTTPETVAPSKDKDHVKKKLTQESVEQTCVALTAQGKLLTEENVAHHLQCLISAELRRYLRHSLHKKDSEEIKEQTIDIGMEEFTLLLKVKEMWVRRERKLMELLEKKNAESEEYIHYLIEKLSAQDKRLLELEGSFTQVQDENDRLVVKNTELKERVLSQRQQMMNLEEKMMETQTESKHRSERIDDNESSMRKKELRIEELEKKVLYYEHQMTSLQEEVHTNKDRLTRKEDLMHAKDETIISLNNSLGVEKSQVEKLDAQVKKQNVELFRLRRDLETMRRIQQEAYSSSSAHTTNSTSPLAGGLRGNHGEISSGSGSGSGVSSASVPSSEIS